jgi:hypothetical protein
VGPKDTERLLTWRSTHIDASNVDAYIPRHVENGSKPPFDYRLMSKVLHPKDWTPQQEIYAFDLDVLWAKLAKPRAPAECRRAYPLVTPTKWRGYSGLFNVA